MICETHATSKPLSAGLPFHHTNDNFSLHLHFCLSTKSTSQQTSSKLTNQKSLFFFFSSSSPFLFRRTRHAKCFELQPQNVLFPLQRVLWRDPALSICSNYSEQRKKSERVRRSEKSSSHKKTQNFFGTSSSSSRVNISTRV